MPVLPSDNWPEWPVLTGLEIWSIMTYPSCKARQQAALAKWTIDMLSLFEEEFPPEHVAWAKDMHRSRWIRIYEEDARRQAERGFFYGGGIMMLLYFQRRDNDCLWSRRRAEDFAKRVVLPSTVTDLLEDYEMDLPARSRTQIQEGFDHFTPVAHLWGSVWLQVSMDGHGALPFQRRRSLRAGNDGALWKQAIINLEFDVPRFLSVADMLYEWGKEQHIQKPYSQRQNSLLTDPQTAWTIPESLKHPYCPSGIYDLRHDILELERQQKAQWSKDKRG
jgi:hypothetical protein